ncbi:MAG: ATP-binding protein [Micropruina sp.]
MIDKLALVEQLMLLPRETRQVEFKSASGMFAHDKALEYCAALAHEGGGHLILGVTDKPPRMACGTQAFLNTQDVEHKFHRKLGLRVEVDELTIDGRRVVVIEVGSRPAGRPVALDGRYLMRQGESLVDMTPDRLRAIFAETEPPFLDTPQVGGLTPEAVEDLLATREFFALSGVDGAEVPRDATQRCHALAANGILTDEGGRFGVTGLGASLLARRMADFPALTSRRLRFVQYAGSTRTSARRDILPEGGYALEFRPLLELVNAAVPVDERIHAAHRVNVPMYNPVGLREILANAIAHQDFQAHPSLIAVELYEDRIEVTNPGEPLLDPRRFAEDTRPRNLSLALMMRELKMCEARGSGVQRTLEANEETGAADPKFYAGDGLTKAVLIGKHDFMTMSASERNWAVFMHACRMWAGRRPMTNNTFRNRYGLADGRSSLVSLHIQQAMDEGLIVPMDAESSSRRYARYIPFYAGL